MAEPRIVIIGAGPAGLTAALELVRAGRPPIVLDLEAQVGGISRTIVHGGNRMDLGGHRFFSKSDWVMDWWREILPVADPEGSAPTRITYRRQSRELEGRGPGRKCRIPIASCSSGVAFRASITCASSSIIRSG